MVTYYQLSTIWVRVVCLVMLILTCSGLSIVAYGADVEWTLLSDRPNVVLPALTSLTGSALDPADTRIAGWADHVKNLESKYPQYDLEDDVILFIGSSSFTNWTTVASAFPGRNIINNGFGGSQIVDSIVYFDRLVKPLAPQTIVMYAGSNDVVSKPPLQVLADYITFTQRVHAAFPETVIYYLSIAPSYRRWEHMGKVKEANALIAAYTATDERLVFIDVYSYMVAEDGIPIARYFRSDQLHPSADGYALWTEILRNYLGSDDGLKSSNGQQVGIADIIVTPFLQSQTVTGPVDAQVEIVTQPANLPLEQVQVSLNGKTIYTGAQKRFSLPLNQGELTDGVQQLRIEAQTAAASMTRTQRFVVDNHRLYIQGDPQNVSRTLLVRLETSLPVSAISSVRLLLDDVVVWNGTQVPESVRIETRAYTEGTHRLEARLVTNAGIESVESGMVAFKNRWMLQDDANRPFHFMGTTFDQSVTHSESAGWQYDTLPATDLFGDVGRRVRIANTQEELVWPAAQLHRAVVTLYTQDEASLAAVQLSVSADEQRWDVLEFTATLEETAASGWLQYQLVADVPEQSGTKLFKLTFLPSDILPQQLQVGRVRLDGWN